MASINRVEIAELIRAILEVTSVVPCSIVLESQPFDTIL
jgi:hypothetical protein